VGSKYMWSNLREDGGYVKERLDRALANKEWCAAFKDKEVQVLAARSSDHKPLLICFSTNRPFRHTTKRGFKFEASWMLEKDFDKVIQEEWKSSNIDSNQLTAISNKLKRCGDVLKSWSREKLCNTEKIIKSKIACLEALQREEGPWEVAEIKILQQEIDVLLEQEDLKWKQRAKINWYDKGDRNTSYYHAWANQRHNTTILHTTRALTSTINLYNIHCLAKLALSF
jgi:hypothetical protein